MMQKILSNKKGQFFIAAAVIIIFVITAVFFFIARTGEISNPTLIQRELSFFALNIKEEYGKVLEIALSRVSRGLESDSNAFLDNNLTTFDRYIQTQSLERGVIANVTAARVVANGTDMNITLRLSLSSQGSRLDSNTWIYRAIRVGALNGSLASNPTCTFNVTVRKEFNEPISELNSSNFVLNGAAAFTINGTLCGTATYTEGSAGKYNVTCTSSPCASSSVSVTATDFRNIAASGAISNTGLGNGCAGTCGQPVD